MRADVTLGRGGQQGPADRAGAAVPARGHPDAAVREARPVDVAPGPPSGSAGTSAKRTSRVSLAAMPTAGQVPGGARSRVLTANSRSPSGAPR